VLANRIGKEDSKQAMRTQKKSSLFTLVLPVLIVAGASFVYVAAQTPAPLPLPRKPPTTPAVSSVILQNKPPAPQVVTILHRLNGLKVLNLIRSKKDFEAIARLDHDFQLSGDVHTNVIAGLALDDGKTIIAWLPEAEAELPPVGTLFAPRTPAPPKAYVPVSPAARASTPTAPPRVPAPEIPDLPNAAAIEDMARAAKSLKMQGNFLGPADIKVITREGKRIIGRYIGLDGLTGLSLIKLDEGSLPGIGEPKANSIAMGQRLRVIGPQPAPGAETGARTPLYIRIGETEATVTNISRSPSGSIARVKVRSAKFSPANIGGIAINENNETLGIVDGVEGGEATIVPMALVRLAAKRLNARQASVPRPWLGIKGEPVGSVSLERIMRIGWQLDRARALTEKRQGILLTSVAPGSPAALAKLKAGDVILSVNNGFIRSAEEFSWLLDEAGPESPVLFRVARPETETSEAMEIKLSESSDPLFGRMVENRVTKVYRRRSLLGEGVETVVLKPRVASRFGSTGGLLVTSIQPATEAFKAGLRPGDVIESINGQPVHVYGVGASATATPAPGRSTCIVVRNKEKIALTFQYSTDPPPNKQ
jgi:S1-C subfamily serine protease